MRIAPFPLGPALSKPPLQLMSIRRLCNVVGHRHKTASVYILLRKMHFLSPNREEYIFCKLHHDPFRYRVAIPARSLLIYMRPPCVPAPGSNLSEFDVFEPVASA